MPKKNSIPKIIGVIVNIIGSYPIDHTEQTKQVNNWYYCFHGIYLISSTEASCRTVQYLSFEIMIKFLSC